MGNVGLTFAPQVSDAQQAGFRIAVTGLLDDADDEPVSVEFGEHGAHMTLSGGFIETLLNLPAGTKLNACKYGPCYALRWWNALSAEQMVAALYGDTASDEQAAAAKKPYHELDQATRDKVDAAAMEINGGKSFDSVGAWWESLDCRKMRIAAGDGNTADSMSAYCRHYPGSDFPPEKILSADALAHVNTVGKALLGRTDLGTYPAPG